jgi:hypothetical protein
MRFNRNFAATLVAAVTSFTVGGLSLACDHCRGRTPCHVCGTTDDRGLLDGLDRVAQLVQPRLPRLPSLDSALRIAFSDRGSCDNHASCGCELNAPSCGCELKEATCGCELKEPTCGCESPEVCDCQNHAGFHTSQPPAQRHNAHSGQYPSPKQLPYTTPSAPQPLAPFTAPTPIPQQGPNPVQPRVPELVPLPDNEVNPFRDDAAARVRRIPARTIQYRQSTPANSQNYAPQASRDSVRVRMSDDTVPARTQLALDESSSNRTHAIDASKRNGSVELRQPVVVTAAAESHDHSSAAYYQSNKPITTRPIEIRNPLRD